MAQSTVVCSHLNLSNSYEINREFMDNHYLNITVTVKSDKPYIALQKKHSTNQR